MLSLSSLRFNSMKRDNWKMAWEILSHLPSSNLNIQWICHIHIQINLQPLRRFSQSYSESRAKNQLKKELIIASL